MNENLKKVIKESGNNLHLEVVGMLEAAQWDVALSPHYYDETTNKPREIDIRADKIIFVDDQRKEVGRFHLCLFIECKYFKEPLAFRMRQNNKDEAKKALILEGLLDKETLIEQHHLFSGHRYFKKNNIGKLYDSTEENKVFNALTQPVKSLVFFRDLNPIPGLYYPITVYSGIDGIYEIQNDNVEELDKLQPSDYSIFGLNYSYRSVVTTGLRIQDFFVEFLHKNLFKKYLATVEWEARELKEFFKFRARRKNNE